MTEIPKGSNEGTAASTVGNYSKADDDLAFLLGQTNFDYDTALILYPNLAVENSPEARGVLAWYRQFYTELSKSPQTTAIIRSNIVPLERCYGLGAEPEYQLGVLDIRVYANLTPDKIKFVKSADYQSAVIVIDCPSVAVTDDALSPETRPVTLFSSRRTNAHGLGLSTEPDILTGFGESPQATTTELINVLRRQLANDGLDQNNRRAQGQLETRFWVAHEELAE